MKDFDDHAKKIIFDERGLSTLEGFCYKIETGKNLSSKNYV